MPSDRTRAIAEAIRLAEGDARRFGDALAEQRLRLGLTKSAIARAAGVSRTLVWRAERGDPGVPQLARARCARAVGGTARLAFYADATPLIYDAASMRMVERITRDAEPAWDVSLEAPVPGPGHRSVDVRLDGRHDVVLIEVESHVRRWEEILRELAGKRLAFAEAGEPRTVHVVLAVPPTRHHRELVRALPSSIAASLPVAPAEASRALALGGRWPGDGLLWVASGAARQRHRCAMGG